MAAIEIISPSNKDRPEHRRLFVDKVVALLRQEVCVSIVDLVTARQANLYAEWLELMGRSDPASNGSPIYAATVRNRKRGRKPSVLDTWYYPLTLGRPLPPLHLWLADNLGVTVDLEATYEETCRVLHIT